MGSSVTILKDDDCVLLENKKRFTWVKLKDGKEIARSPVNVERIYSKPGILLTGGKVVKRIEDFEPGKTISQQGIVLKIPLYEVIGYRVWKNLGIGEFERIYYILDTDKYRTEFS